jgi:cell division protein FtsL
MQLKGRHHLLLWLLLFLVVAGGIVARQNASIAAAGRLSRLREERTTLEARQADLTGQIREASSRRALAPVAEAMGLHEPSDSEVSYLKLPVDDRRP